MPSHITWERNILTNHKEFVQRQNVSLGDGCTVDALGVGDVHVNMQFKISKSRKCVIYHVLCVPELACNLFSVRAAATKGNHIKFGQTNCWIGDGNEKLYGMDSMIDKLYRLNCELATQQHNTEDHAAVTSEGNNIDLWHDKYVNSS